MNTKLKAAASLHTTWTPEERLCWRVIVHGLADGDVEWFEEGWFDGSWWLSFNNICFILGLDVKQAREGCLKIVRERRGKEVKKEFVRWCKEDIDGRDIKGGLRDGTL
jgi:hypothetical protein